MAALATGETTVCDGGLGFHSISHHLILQILAYLDCESLSKSNTSNSTLCVLSRLLLTRIPMWKTIYAEAADSTGRVGSEDLKGAIKHLYQESTSYPNCGFLFASSCRKVVELEEVAQYLPKQAVIIGGTAMAIANASTSGGLCVETDYQPSKNHANFTLSLSNFPETERYGFYFSPEEVKNAGKAIASIPDSAYEDGWKVFVILANQSVADGLDEFVQSLQKTYEQSQIVGGLMGEVLVMIQEGKAATYREGLVCMAIGGATVFSSQVSRACKPLTNIGEIVESEMMFLRSIREHGVERPALDFIQEGYNRAQAMPFIGITRDVAEGFALHDVRGATEGGDVVIGTDAVTPGHFLQVFMLDAESTKEDLKQRLEAAKRACANQSKQVLGGLLFTCGGRGNRFYKAKDVETNIFTNAMPNIGMSGVFAGGEIGPEALAALPADSTFRRGAQIQGFTAVFGIFFVPRFVVPNGQIIDKALANRQFSF